MKLPEPECGWCDTLIFLSLMGMTFFGVTLIRILLTSH